MSLIGGCNSVFCNGTDYAASTSALDVSNSVMPNVADHPCMQRNVNFTPQKWSNALGKPLSNGRIEGNGTNNGYEGNGNLELPTPSVVLYEGKIDFSLKPNRTVGCGLVNLGNTCFLSSTLQCLCHLPPWFNYVTSDHHGNSCKMNRIDCFVCMFQRFVRNTIRCHGSPFAPREIVDKLKQICGHMQRGRQEDAHEFLLSLLNGMQTSLLHGQQRLDHYSQETTILCQIFGGYLRSQITCKRCQWTSNTYEHFFNISLDIKNAKSLLSALTAYTKTESLEGENAYKCDRCRKPAPAEKRYSVYKAPNVLIFQLKRYYMEEKGHSKLGHHVLFQDMLDLTPFLSKSAPCFSHLYRLQCVLVHLGTSINSGHYYAYVCGANNKWHEMNDERVREVSFEEVKSAQAYMLFYVRKAADSVQKPSLSTTSSSSDKSTPKNSPLVACKNKPNVMNGALVRNGLQPSLSNSGANRNNSSAPLVTNSNGSRSDHGNGGKLPLPAINGSKPLANGSNFNANSSVENGSSKNGDYPNGNGVKDADVRKFASSVSSAAPGYAPRHASGSKLASSSQREKVVFTIGRPRDRCNASSLSSSSTSTSISKAPVISSNGSSTPASQSVPRLVAYDDESDLDSDCKSAGDVPLGSEQKTETASLGSQPNPPSESGVSSDKISVDKPNAPDEKTVADKTASELSQTLSCDSDSPAQRTALSIGRAKDVPKSFDLECLPARCSEWGEPEKAPKLKRSSSDSKLDARLISKDSMRPQPIVNCDRNLLSSGEGLSRQFRDRSVCEAKFSVKALYNEDNEFVAVDITENKNDEGMQETLQGLEIPDNDAVLNADGFDASTGPADVQVKNDCEVPVADEKVASAVGDENETHSDVGSKKRRQSRDDSPQPRKRHKHKHRKKKARKSSDSEDDVWIERTLETIEQEQNGCASKKHQTSHKVSDESKTERTYSVENHKLKNSKHETNGDDRNASRLLSGSSCTSPSQQRDTVRDFARQRSRSNHRHRSRSKHRDRRSPSRNRHHKSRRSRSSSHDRRRSESCSKRNHLTNKDSYSHGYSRHGYCHTDKQKGLHLK